MKRFLVLAAASLMLATPRALAGGGRGEVTAVSVLPGSGSVRVVIDVRGSVSVNHFTLRGPARLVIDVTGATLRTPSVSYDGTNRGGVVGVRYAQFRPDVVRIVLELDGLRDYQLDQADDAVRIEMGTDQTFTAWSSVAPAAAPVLANRGGAQAAPVRVDAPAIRRAARPQPLPQASQQPVITVTFDSVSMAEVAATFAAYSGKSIVLGRDVSGRVTAEIKSQPWDVAFQAILDAQGLAATEDPPGIIRVSSPAVLAARDSLEPLRTIILPVNYARAGGMIPSITGVVSKRGKVVADTATNSLIITDVDSRISDDSAFVAQLDIPTPQVAIQAKLIFVDRQDIENLGVRYDLGTSQQFFNALVARPDPATAQPVDTDGDGVPDQLLATDTFDPTENIIDIGGNALSALANAEGAIASPALRLIFSTAIGNFNLTSFVEALQQVSLADLQAEPLITTADNSPAAILVGERTPVRQVDVGSATGGGFQPARATTQFVETGIKLEVTPHVTNNNQILMKLHAENSSLREAPADVGFTFQTQEADNQLLVDDGQTAVIGGLTVTQVTVAKSGIPFLVDLPIIGRIFGFTSRTETRRDLLILVTPHVIKDQGLGAVRR